LNLAKVTYTQCGLYVVHLKIQITKIKKITNSIIYLFVTS